MGSNGTLSHSALAINGETLMIYVIKINEEWRGTMVNGKASFRVAQKMKAVKIKIKKWSKEKGRSEGMYTQSLFHDIKTIDRVEDKDVLFAEELVHKES